MKKHRHASRAGVYARACVCCAHMHMHGKGGLYFFPPWFFLPSKFLESFKRHGRFFGELLAEVMRACPRVCGRPRVVRTRVCARGIAGRGSAVAKLTLAGA